MLLRSSSTPILLSEIPTATHSRKSHTLDNFSGHSHHRCSLLHFPAFCCNDIVGYSKLKPNKPTHLRKSRSDSNLEDSNCVQDFKPKIGSFRVVKNRSMLQSEPSFSFYADEDGLIEDDKGELEVEKSSEEDVIEFSFVKRGMGLIVEDDEDDRLSGFENLSVGEKEDDANGNDNGVKLKGTSFDELGDDEEHYKRILSEDPSNPLFLSNYAELLQSKGDVTGAEEYYFRATMADPKDGEILMKYARLVWELHKDQDTAATYFESAARASPEDCNVLAAYARFLWEIDRDEDDDEDTAEGGLVQRNLEVEERSVRPLLPLNLGTELGFRSKIDYATEDGDVGEYYKRIVDENPCNPLVLRNYAYFLRQRKGDPEGAEEYYSRAILADPRDGEAISQYAQLVWELHHDKEKASSYFERSVQAAPADSHVLGAYAKFLWETEEDEASVLVKHGIRLPFLQGAATSA